LELETKLAIINQLYISYKSHEITYSWWLFVTIFRWFRHPETTRKTQPRLTQPILLGPAALKRLSQKVGEFAPPSPWQLIQPSQKPAV